MSNPNRVAGQARVKIDGVSYPTAGETSLEIGGKSREAVPGDYDTSSFKESEVPSKIEVTVLYKSSVDLAALRSIDNAFRSYSAANRAIKRKADRNAEQGGSTGAP